MSRATISTKGQLVIPTRFRKALHLQAGDKVSLTLEGDRLLLQREQPRHGRLVRGKFGRPVLVAPPGAPPMTPERIKALHGEEPRGTCSTSTFSWRVRGPAMLITRASTGD